MVIIRSMRRTACIDHFAASDARQRCERYRDDCLEYETKYYIIHTDLDPDDAHEAAIRVTKMAEVYADRTRGFSGVIRKKFPFILFKDVEDYHAAGGPEGSAGVFNGSR